MQNDKKFMALLIIFSGALIVNPILGRSLDFSGSLLGHSLGIIGSILMLLTLIYPYRKRIQGKKGKKNPIGSHIYFGMLGPSLVVLHSSYGKASIIGTLAFLSMLLSVLSGIAGTFLYVKLKRSLKEQSADLVSLKELFRHRKPQACALRSYLRTGRVCAQECCATGMPENPMHEEVTMQERCKEFISIAHSISELEYTTTIFNSAKSLFSRWLQVHIHIVVFLFAMLIVHVVANVYYGITWLR